MPIAFEIFSAKKAIVQVHDVLVHEPIIEAHADSLSQSTSAIEEASDCKLSYNHVVTGGYG